MRKRLMQSVMNNGFSKTIVFFNIVIKFYITCEIN